MTKLKRLKTLLQRGYFPAELPPPFFTDTFAHYRTSILKAWAMHKSPNTKPEAYNYPRIGHARRSLAIVNPVSFIHLAKLIADSWPTLRTHMRKSRIATSIPEIIEDGERAISKPDFAGAEKNELEIYCNYNYFLTADVSRFYNSMYTHTLPLALSGKDYCKKHLNDAAFRARASNQLDVLTRKGQDNQSIGLPIGPDTSRILSEIIISQIDVLLQEKIELKNGQAVRNVDDWFIGFNTLGEAESALNSLRTFCHIYELELNFEKTRLLDTAKGAKSLWEIDLRGHEIPKARSQKSAIEHFFSKAFHYQEQHPDKNIMLYALRVSRNFDVFEEYWNIYETYILACARSNPTTIPTCAQIFINYNYKHYPLNVERITKFIADTIVKHGSLRFHGEISWVLFLAKGLRINIPKYITNIISEFDSSVCSLLALDLRERGLMSGRFDVAHFQAVMNPAALKSDRWLLSYELGIKGWIKGISAQYIDNDAHFSVLKNKGITFYDENRNVERLETTRERTKKMNIRNYSVVPGRAPWSF